MDQRESEVFVEEVSQELAHPDVGPAPVHQQQPLQVAELSEGVVTRHDSLHALLATDPNSNVGSWVRDTNTTHEVGQRDRNTTRATSTLTWTVSRCLFCHNAPGKLDQRRTKR